ncbi:tetratricopeptide repeat protein [Corynebacterium poyangense]|uniref:Tetratricopeptide repeat protein n=1 Tax=Corynebacterium poyangense TaxID=2684405 RepID=A0A7H0SRY1_9CORY|nr:tetratricopeptide repeat protein [Corynebacterium poyangense]QNQ91306.1 tetratricopeptide repeat protein [Corynebacterium poyangense]
MLHHHPAHDSCEPNLARDLEVIGEIPPASLRAHHHHHQEIEAPLLVRPAIHATMFHVEPEIIARSRQIPVFVLLGGPLHPGVKYTRQLLSTAAIEAGGSWVFAWIDADQEPEVITQFRPENLPRLYAVADGTAIGSTPLGESDEILEWVRNAVHHAAARLPGLPAEAILERPDHNSGHTDYSGDDVELPATELQRAAIAVAEGDFEQALEIYQDLEHSTPPAQHDVILRAQAAVGVLQRAQKSTPGADPISVANAHPEDVSLALAAADAEIILDQPEDAICRLKILVKEPEARARLIEVLRLLPANHELVAATRQEIAAAIF